MTNQCFLTCEQCRTVDRYAIEQLGFPGVVLMENAGRNAADHIERWARQRLRESKRTLTKNSTALICMVCGKGNNGGDGFVIARQLANRGWPVLVDLAADPATLTGDAKINYNIAHNMGLTIYEMEDSASLEAAVSRWRQAVVLVDALLGTGFTGQVREPLAGIIERMNSVASAQSTSNHPLIVAIDVPSGLDADTGTAFGSAIQAHRTITFLANKVGYKNRTARKHLGRVTVCDIGAPLELILQRLANS